jgi:hypothetical protein
MQLNLFSQRSRSFSFSFPSPFALELPAAALAAAALAVSVVASMAQGGRLSYTQRKPRLYADEFAVFLWRAATRYLRGVERSDACRAE